MREGSHLLGLAVILLIISVFSVSWFRSSDKYDPRAGIVFWEACEYVPSTVCERRAELPAKYKKASVVGLLVFGVSLSCILLLGFIAFRLQRYLRCDETSEKWTDPPSEGQLRLGFWLCLVSVGLGIFFVALLPQRVTGIDYAFVTHCLGGIVGAIVCSGLLPDKSSKQGQS